MTDPDHSYRPQSPDFSSVQPSFPAAPNHPPSSSSSFPLASPLGHRASYDASPFFTPQYHQQRPAATQQYVPPFPVSGFPQQSHPYSQQYPEDPEMARRSSRIAQGAESGPQPKYEEDHSDPDYPEEPPAAAAAGEMIPEQPVKMEQHEHEIASEPVKSRIGEGIEVKTKFPVARIKRIMQADEDVGKVAQVTPIAVCTLSPSPPFPFLLCLFRLKL